MEERRYIGGQRGAGYNQNSILFLMSGLRSEADGADSIIKDQREKRQWKIDLKNMLYGSAFRR